MTELTKQHFDRELGSIRTELKSYADEQTEKLARIVADAFTEQHKYLETRFQDLEKDLDLRSTVLTLERRLAKLEQQRH